MSAEQGVKERLTTMWDETWDYISEGRRPSLGAAGALETRFQEELDGIGAAMADFDRMRERIETLQTAIAEALVAVRGPYWPEAEKILENAHSQRVNFKHADRRAANSQAGPE